MRSPFPGMDPWLENPRTWRPFHTLLVAELARHCSPMLPEHYYVSIEHRSYIVIGDDPEEVQLPDVGVRIDYRDHPDPPLKPEDESWADQLLRDHGLR